jgi:hypothetical protein
MAEITKVALKVDNNNSFPNNNAGAITPAILRAFNVNMIDSMVDEIGYNADSASWNVSISNINAFTASAQSLTTASLLITASAVSNIITFTKGNGSTFNVTVADTTDLSQLNQATSSLQQFTASAQISINNLNTTTASLNSSVTQLNANTASQQVSINNLNTTTASLLVETQNLELFSASALISITNLNQSSASQQTQINSLIAGTGSYATTGSNTFVGANTFTSISASSFISASQFVGDGSKLTGLTSSISMPILDEGIPQGNAVSLNFTGSAIGATVVGGIAIISVNGLDTGSYNALTQSFNSYTASTNADLNAIHQATASLQQFTASFSTSSLVSTSSFNAYTASNDQRVTSLETNSASVNISITNVNSATASLFTSVNNLNSATQSLQGQLTTIGSQSGSWITESETGSFARTDINNTFTGIQTFDSVIVTGTASVALLNVTIESSSVIYSSGSNVFGDATNDTQTLNGTVIVSGSQQITGSLGITGNITMVNGTDLITHHVRAAGSNGLELQTSAGTNIVAMGQGGGTQAVFVGAVSANSISASTINGLGDPLAFSTSVDSRLDSLEGVSGSFTTTASFNSYTSSNDAKVNSLISATGSYATTGSNSFTGDQTFIDNASNFFTISDASGSMMLVAKGFTSASAHMSASAAGIGNFIFKTNSNTADTIVSGSNNIFTNQTAPTAGFKRYIGGSNNIINSTSGPQISGSMQFSPGLNANYYVGTMNMRGPVSSSAWNINNNIIQGTANIGSNATNNAEKAVAGFTMTGNSVNGTFAFVANRSLHTQGNTISNNILTTATLTAASSSITYTNNIGGITITNNASGSGAAVTNVANATYVSNNLFLGPSNTITATGSSDPGDTSGTAFVRESNFNQILGYLNGVNLPYAATGSNALNATMIAGVGLGVTGSNASFFSTGFEYGGSAFFGRYNALDANRAQSAQTVFAIGTGNSTTRKTGFLIDSGSNTFIEGTLNVSGSTTMTGSLILSSSNAIELQVIGNSVFTGSANGNVVSMSITSNTASMDLNLGNYFTLTLADTATTHISASNVQPGVSATLVITTGTNSSASLAPTMLQPSGSAYSATNGSAKKDVLSIVAVASGVPFVVSTKNMI